MNYSATEHILSALARGECATSYNEICEIFQNFKHSKEDYLLLGYAKHKTASWQRSCCIGCTINSNFVHQVLHKEVYTHHSFSPAHLLAYQRIESLLLSSPQESLSISSPTLQYLNIMKSPRLQAIKVVDCPRLRTIVIESPIQNLTLLNLPLLSEIHSLGIREFGIHAICTGLFRTLSS